MCDPLRKPENFVEIYRQLSCHLSATNQTTNVTQQFRHLATDSERVDFVGELLQNSGWKLDYCENLKNNEKSLKLRQIGNEFFKLKQLQQAWEYYTRSLAYAEENSENLSIAYANRSAVLYELQLYDECLTDIQRALDGNYPEQLKEKLKNRARNSKTHQSSRSASYESLPTIVEKNPKIESAANSISINSNKESGRHIVANRDIEPGEILAIERPFATLLVDKFYNHCHECLKICYNLIPCKYCPETLYCCENCCEKAYRAYHRYECRILATIKTLQFDKLKLLPLKIVLMLKDSIFDSCKIEQKSDIYYSNRYWEIHNLITNNEKRSIGDLFERTLVASILYNLIENHTIFFQNESINFQQQFKQILLRLLQIAPSNFHEITELAADQNGIFIPEEIGSGAYSFLSLLNHSCCPNVIRTCHGDTIILRAIKTIKTNEQCFDNYGYHYALMDKHQRQISLNSQYYFKCCCRACEENWPKYDDLPQFDQLEGVDHGKLSDLSQGNREIARQILGEALRKLKLAEKLMPCRNFCQLQEIVKQCYSIFGNKRFLF